MSNMWCLKILRNQSWKDIQFWHRLESLFTSLFDSEVIKTYKTISKNHHRAAKAATVPIAQQAWSRKTNSCPLGEEPTNEDMKPNAWSDADSLAFPEKKWVKIVAWIAMGDPLLLLRNRPSSLLHKSEM